MSRIEDIWNESLNRFSDAKGVDALKAMRISKEEAGEVLAAYWEIIEAHPEYRATLRLVEHIDQEMARGWRCAVCLDIDNEDCREGC